MITRIERDDRVLSVDHVHARRFDDELVILDLNGGSYYAMNAVGARIWEEFQAGNTPAQVAEALVLAYQVDYERAVNDCVEVANQLFERGLIRRR